MKRPSITRIGLTLFLSSPLFTLVPNSSKAQAFNISTTLKSSYKQSRDVLSEINDAFESFKIDDGLDSLTSLAEVPKETLSIARQYHHVAQAGYGAAPFVDFSPLFLALIPIALFLGAAAAFALSVATSSSTAVATAQQQQQQEEQNNNNNAANNNNNNALMAAMLAAFTNNINTNTPTFIIVNNATSLASLFGLSALGRSMDSSMGLNQNFGRWWRQRKRRRQRRSLK